MGRLETWWMCSKCGTIFKTVETRKREIYLTEEGWRSYTSFIFKSAGSCPRGGEHEWIQLTVGRWIE